MGLDAAFLAAAAAALDCRFPHITICFLASARKHPFRHLHTASAAGILEHTLRAVNRELQEKRWYRDDLRQPPRGEHALNGGGPVASWDVCLMSEAWSEADIKLGV